MRHYLCICIIKVFLILILTFKLHSGFFFIIFCSDDPLRRLCDCIFINIFKFSKIIIIIFHNVISILKLIILCQRKTPWDEQDSN